MAKSILSSSSVTGVQLVRIDLNAPPPQLLMEGIGPQQAGFSYNAMGYNPKDDFLYAIKNNSSGSDNKDLIRIGQDGVPRYVATLTDIQSMAIVGEFDFDGYMHIVDENRRYYKYDLNGPTPQLVANTQLSISGSPAAFQDFGLYNGYLWGIAASVSGGGTNYRILRIPLTGPVVPELGPVRNVPNKQMSFTSVFAAKNGVYAYDTTGGNFVRIDMSSNDINQMELQFLAQGEQLPGSDGAKCQISPLGLPADIVVEKSTSESLFTPGQQIEFTISVRNAGPWGAVGITFSDPLPAGAISATWSCSASGAEATCEPSSGTGSISATLNLPSKDDKVSFQVTMETDPNASSDFVNTATVTVPEDFEDAPGNNSATAIVPLPGMDFSAEKTGELADKGKFTAAGDVILYSVTVVNDSSLPFTSVSVTDPGPTFGGMPGTGQFLAFEPASADVPAGGTRTFTASYTITEQDFANLSQAGTTEVLNTAVVTVTGQSGHTSTREVSSTVKVAAPAIQVDKTGELIDLVGPLGANGEPVPDVGDRIDYILVVKNTGTEPLEQVVLTDPLIVDLVLEQSDLDPAGVLAPGAAMTYRGSHTITAEDLMKGEVLNTATVSASVVDRPDLPILQHSDDHLEKLQPRALFW